MIQKDIASILTPKIGAAITSLTAGGGGDNTAVVGLTIDRAALGLPLCAQLTIAWEAVLAAAATLTLKNVLIEQSADGTNWDATAYKTFTDPGVVATGPGGGGTVRGATEFSVDLQSAKQFVRVKHTPDLSAANTDTAKTSPVWNFAGFDRLPSA
ncbi:MAG: hypothetical protein E6G97_25930 [Alphaproteobacteria bacterium]|nr:MAG: hypothetical protein E6G97_25930 [Alphaproteobacteria bacterium]